MLHAPLTITTAKLDISLLLKPTSSPPASDTSSVPPAPDASPAAASALPAHPSNRSPISRSISVPATTSTHSPPSSYQRYPQAPLPSPYTEHFGRPSPPRALAPTQQPYPPAQKRPPPTTPHPSASPAKKQSKWTPEEDALIIDLRGSGMKWEDISKRLPGRSAISCRLHYQNYLERRSEWDEERKNRLARLYERFKPEMWTPLATELGIPWRAAEAMHWQLGEQDMARRAGVVPFSSITPSSASAAGTMSSTSSISGTSSLGTAGEGSGARGRRGRETGRRRESLPSGNVRVRREQQGLLPSLAELESGVPAYVGPFGRGDDEEREGRREGG
ncbi:MAG: hypothetical protein LQ347_001722 [Umbilicaria vellea]|nr:MAG: hypothetical protein LQ347_001722 [Umbilicaria vellea]